MKWLLLIVLLTATPCIDAQDDMSCKILAITKEAQGEPLIGARAVLDVLENRMKAKKQSACQIVLAKSQWPWAAKQKNWHYSVDMLRRYERVNWMKPVLDEKYIYFNTVPHSFGKKVKKIGNHYFSQ